MDTGILFVLIFGGILLFVVVVKMMAKSNMSTANQEIKSVLKEKYPMDYALWVMFAIRLENPVLTYSFLTSKNGGISSIINKSMATVIPELLKKHNIDINVKHTPFSMPIEKSDIDFFEAYRTKNLSIIEQYEQIVDKNVAYYEAFKWGKAGSMTSQQIQTQTFGKKKEKSAAGAMVKGAVVGKLIGGDAGAVVGAMVAKEKHDNANK